MKVLYKLQFPEGAGAPSTSGSYEVSRNSAPQILTYFPFQNELFHFRVKILPPSEAGKHYWLDLAADSEDVPLVEGQHVELLAVYCGPLPSEQDVDSEEVTEEELQAFRARRGTQEPFDIARYPISFADSTSGGNSSSPAAGLSGGSAGATTAWADWAADGDADDFCSAARRGSSAGSGGLSSSSLQSGVSSILKQAASMASTAAKTISSSAEGGGGWLSGLAKTAQKAVAKALDAGSSAVGKVGAAAGGGGGGGAGGRGGTLPGAGFGDFPSPGARDSLAKLAVLLSRSCSSARDAAAAPDTAEGDAAALAEMLDGLWAVAFPDAGPMQQVSERWQQLGFLTSDPVSELQSREHSFSSQLSIRSLSHLAFQSDGAVLRSLLSSSSSSSSPSSSSSSALPIVPTVLHLSALAAEMLGLQAPAQAAARAAGKAGSQPSFTAAASHLEGERRTYWELFSEGMDPFFEIVLGLLKIAEAAARRAGAGGAVVSTEDAWRIRPGAAAAASSSSPLHAILASCSEACFQWLEEGPQDMEGLYSLMEASGVRGLRH